MLDRLLRNLRLFEVSEPNLLAFYDRNVSDSFVMRANQSSTFSASRLSCFIYLLLEFVQWCFSLATSSMFPVICKKGKSKLWDVNSKPNFKRWRQFWTHCKRVKLSAHSFWCRTVVLKLLKKLLCRPPYNFFDHFLSHLNLSVNSGSAANLNDLTMSLLPTSRHCAFNFISTAELCQKKRANLAVRIFSLKCYVY